MRRLAQFTGTLAAAWRVRRHIARATLGTLPCAKCKTPVVGTPYREYNSSHQFECGCGAIWWAPFGWTYVRMLIESQMKEGNDVHGSSPL